MSDPWRPSRWEDLLRQAYEIIDHVNREHQLLTSWTLGGGTALMLQIAHRESHDIDLFLDDPQLLPYIQAAARELQFGMGTPAYSGDGSNHLKIAFDQIGEIDFILAGSTMDGGSAVTDLLGREVNLETVPEIICKKVRYRGSMIQPRDVFDIAAANAAGHAESIRIALSEIPEHRAVAASCLDRLNDDYVNSVINQLMIRPAFETVALDAIPLAKELLQP